MRTLYIPTIAPRPVDGYDRLCEIYATTNGAAALHAMHELEAQAQLNGEPLMDALDEAIRHGLLVAKYAR